MPVWPTVETEIGGVPFTHVCVTLARMDRIAVSETRQKSNDLWHFCAPMSVTMLCASDFASSYLNTKVFRDAPELLGRPFYCHSPLEDAIAEN